VKIRYRADEAHFSADAYSVKGWRGIAFGVLGWEQSAPDEDGDTSDTGKVVVVMVGDDKRWVVNEDDITPLAEHDYCGGCGQIGCHASA
jgi:hypothetical protein